MNFDYRKCSFLIDFLFLRIAGFNIFHGYISSNSIHNVHSSRKSPDKDANIPYSEYSIRRASCYAIEPSVAKMTFYSTFI